MLACSALKRVNREQLRDGLEGVRFFYLKIDYEVVATNVPLYPEFQAFFRQYQPPTLIVWGLDTDMEELAVLFGMMKVGRRFLHCRLHRETAKGTGRSLPGVRRSIPVYCGEVSRVPDYFKAALG